MKKYWISKRHAAQHVCACGVTGTGKTSLFRQAIYQFLDMGIPCVFLDINREFIEEFYQTGDWILDPGDMRCPYWALEDEVSDEMRAMGLAYSAFPDEPRDNPFFKKNPRALLAYLLGNHKPTTQRMAEWLADDIEIERRAKGDMAGMISKEAGEMRGGILATIKEFGRSLRLWPNEATSHFSVQQWAKERKGNIFLASMPDTFDALRPVQSMLLDMILLGMQSYPGPGAVFLDEFSRMQRLPKVETSISLQRHSGNPIFLGFQEVSQIKYHYGDLWKAIVSQPYTQFVFRTMEDEAAKHAAGLLGQAQIERIRESRQRWNFMFHHPHRTYQTERVMEYVVTPGQIQCLPDMHGFMTQEGYVVPIHIPLQKPVRRAIPLIPRYIEIPPITVPEEPPKTSYRTRRKRQAS